MIGKMKAVVKEAPGVGAKLVEVDIPQVGSREVLVKVKATSICGTDYHIYSWDKWSQNRIKPPIIMGHEFCGEVIEIGSEVTSVKIGDYVSAETHVVCEKCIQCKTGNGHICQNCRILGVDMDGAFAEYVKIPETNAWINDKNVDPGVQSIQEPLGNAVFTVLSGEVVAKSVMITGCGPIGLMAIAVAKAAGASSVYASDVSEYRLDLAQKMGATKVFNAKEVNVVSEVNKETEGLGVDVICEMSGAPMALPQAIDMVANGGRISILGLPSKDVSVDVTKISFKGITISGITGRRLYDTWFKTKGLLKSGQLNIEPVITHTFPLEEFDKGMELMAKGICGKVILIP